MNKPSESTVGPVDGGEGRGVPLGGHDERPPTGYRSVDDDVEPDLSDRDFGADEDEEGERRRDPLRKP